MESLQVIKLGKEGKLMLQEERKKKHKERCAHCGKISDGDNMVEKGVEWFCSLMCL